MPLIKNEEGKCPHCDNEYKRDAYISNFGKQYYKVSCPFCGFKGREYWTLQYKKITDLDDDEVIGWTGYEPECEICGCKRGH